MQQFFDVVQSTTGRALPAATVTVYDSTNALATLYSDNGVTTKANPTTTNSDGEYWFYAVNGTYHLTIAAAGFSGDTRQGIVLFDPADPIAAEDVSYTPAGTGAVVTTVQTKLRETVSVMDFGAKGDNSTDDTAAIQAALNSAVSQNKDLHVPAGTYILTSSITATSSGVDCISIVGDGAGLSNLFWPLAVTVGLDLTYTDNYRSPNIVGLSLITSADSLGTALKVMGPETASTTYLGPSVYDLSIHGADVTTQGWSIGIEFYTCWYIELDRVTIKGADGYLSPFAAAVGIKLTSCQVIYASNFVIFHVEVGILDAASGVASHGEGFAFSNFEIVGCTKGISLSADGIAPGTNIGPGHINSNEIGIEVANRYQMSIHDMLIYRTQSSAVTYIGLSLSNAMDCHIHDNTFEGLVGPSTDMYGILITGAGTSDYIQVHDNTFKAFVGTNKYGIVIGTGAGSCNVHDNIADSTIAALILVNSDAEKTNTFRNNYPVIVQPLTANAATPSVGNDINGQWDTVNSVATTITNFTDAYQTQVICVLANDANTTIQHNAGLILKGGVNFVMASGNIITLRRDATVWREVSRTA